MGADTIFMGFGFWGMTKGQKGQLSFLVSTMWKQFCANSQHRSKCNNLWVEVCMVLYCNFVLMCWVIWSVTILKEKFVISSCLSAVWSDQQLKFFTSFICLMLWIHMQWASYKRHKLDTSCGLSLHFSRKKMWAQIGKHFHAVIKIAFFKSLQAVMSSTFHSSQNLYSRTNNVSTP